MRIQTEALIETYKDNLFAIAYHICGSPEDADDVVQEVFIRYHTTDKQFCDERHIRAWLIRVTINRAKNMVASFWRKRSVPLEDYMETLRFETPEDGELFEQVMRLPEKYRMVIHLFYYEDYSVREIAEILGLSEGNVKTRLTRARKLLKKALKEEWSDDDE